MTGGLTWEIAQFSRLICKIVSKKMRNGKMRLTLDMGRNIMKLSGIPWEKEIPSVTIYQSAERFRCPGGGTVP